MVKTGPLGTADKASAVCDMVIGTCTYLEGEALDVPEADDEEAAAEGEGAEELVEGGRRLRTLRDLVCLGLLACTIIIMVEKL